MNKGTWKMLAGVAVIAVLAFVWVQYDSTKPSRSGDNTVYSNSNSNSNTKTKTIKSTTAGQSTDYAFDVVETEQIIEADIQAMEAEARNLAKATANMSDTQMAELQKLRQGAVVRSADGTLNASYKKKEPCADGGKCKMVIVDIQSGELVWSGQWGTGFVETGVGLEVIKREN